MRRIVACSKLPSNIIVLDYPPWPTLVDAREAELVVFRRWVEFHREALGFTPSWATYAC